MADATYTAVDLSRLPAPDIIEALDFNTIEADAVARMVALMPDFESRDSDPATKLLQVVSYIVQLVRQRVNDACRAVMICPPLSGPKTMIVWTTKGTTNAKQEAQAGRDHRQAA